MKNEQRFNIVMIGATGAVGSQVVKSLIPSQQLQRLTLLGRNSLEEIVSDRVQQHTVDVLQADSYLSLLPGHQVAICTLGVGQPSKVSKEVFLKIDKQAVLDFAKACKEAGVQHFELLSSVGINANSSSFYLRSKGELVEEIKALEFQRFSIFEPSMILTPTNRYGILQGIVLQVWPLLKPLLIGGLRKYRGVEVETLGRAIAQHVFLPKKGVEHLQWDDFQVVGRD